MKTALMILALCSATMQQGTLPAPDLGLSGAPQVAPVRARQYVEYLEAPHTITANRPAMVTLRFHVEDGFHVNSHKPASELLIPTQLSLVPAKGVRLRSEVYPAGKPYKLADDTLDVYTGYVEVAVPVEAAKGSYVLEGSLRYQACDRAACYPPKVLKLAVNVTAQ